MAGVRSIDGLRRPRRSSQRRSLFAALSKDQHELCATANALCRLIVRWRRRSVAGAGCDDCKASSGGIASHYHSRPFFCMAASLFLENVSGIVAEVMVAVSSGASEHLHGDRLED
ncbi:hypothetical protein Aduo_015261 [Ancylostoma duodenale]